MGKPKLLNGNRFGRWSVLCESGRSKSGSVIWLCKCDCGTVRSVEGRSLRSGVSKSCGCLGADHRLEAARKVVTKHGGKKERLYNVWLGILGRCLNPTDRHYTDYGGRGITICEAWKDYAAFRDWAIAAGYDPSAKRGACTIDRINNDAGYFPDNCRWVNGTVQCNNRRTNHRLEYNGESHTISEWACISGIRKDTLRRRIEKYGWSIERALTEETHSYKQHSQ